MEHRLAEAQGVNGRYHQGWGICVCVCGGGVQGWVGGSVHIFINVLVLRGSSMLMECEPVDNSGHLVVPEILDVP